MPTAATGFDLEQVDRLLTTTRSVRKRLDLARPVERSVVLDCLRVALQAPTGGNLQHWRWIVVEDQAVRAALAALYREVVEPGMAAALEGAQNPDRRRLVESGNHLIEHLHEVPVHVVPCVLEPFPERAEVFQAANMFGSIMPAVWSFMLALRSRGLGSVITTIHLHRHQAAAEVLGLPADVTQVALIPVAYYIGDDFRPARRDPVENVTYIDGWNNIASLS